MPQEEQELDTLQIYWTEHQDADYKAEGSSWPLLQQNRGICVKDHTEGFYSPSNWRSLHSEIPLQAH